MPAAVMPATSIADTLSPILIAFSKLPQELIAYRFKLDISLYRVPSLLLSYVLPADALDGKLRCILNNRPSSRVFCVLPDFMGAPRSVSTRAILRSRLYLSGPVSKHANPRQNDALHLCDPRMLLHLLGTFAGRGRLGFVFGI